MWLWITGTALATTYTISPADDLKAALEGLEPGDELVLGEGTYEVTQRLGITLVGTESEPIVVRGEDGVVANIHRPNAAQNLIDFDDARWLELRNLVFSGGSAGLRFLAAEDLLIEDCEIRDTADVALRFNEGGAHYRRVQIRRNQIHHTDGTGEGMYLGCPNAGCLFSEGVIEHNWVHHTDGPNVTQGDGIEIKKGSWGNVVRDNVIHDTNFPCILTYDTGGEAPNIVERNVMWNCGAHGIQSAADAFIINNIVLSAAGTGIASQPHEGGAPSQIQIVHNTVVNPGVDAVAIRNPVGSVLVANNALYAPGSNAIFQLSPGSFVAVAGNVVEGDAPEPPAAQPGARGDDLVDAHDGGEPPMDVFPAAGGGLPNAADSEHLVPVDFNGLPRTTADAGAYAFDEDGNPGWVITAGFKEFPTDEPTDPDPPDDQDTDGVEPGPDDENPETGPSPIESESGCGCTSGPQSGALWMGFGLLGLLRRRP